MSQTFQSMPLLLLIDIQKGFDQISHWGTERNNPHAEQNAAKLLRTWRRLKLPLYHIQHRSQNPASLLHESNQGHSFKKEVEPLACETVIRKGVNSAFIGTDLQERLKQANIASLVILGLTTDHCVSTTARMSANFGFQTFVVEDATATFDRKAANGKNFPAQLVHEAALASLNGEFATVVDTAFLLQRLGE